MYNDVYEIAKVATGKAIPEGGAIDTVENFVLAKFGAIQLNEVPGKVVETAKGLEVDAELIDLLVEVVTSLNKVKPEIVTAAEDFIKLLVKDGCVVSKPELDVNAHIVDIVTSAEAIVKAATGKEIKEDTAIGVIVGYVKEVFERLTIANVRTEAMECVRDIEAHEAIDTLATAAKIKFASKGALVDSIVVMIKHVVADNTLRNFVILDAKVGDLVDDLYGIAVAATGKFTSEKVANVVDAVSDLMDNVNILTIVNDVKMLKLHAALDTANRVAAELLNKPAIERIINTTVKQVKNFTDAESTILAIIWKNLSIGAINDALADILFESTMEALRAGTTADKVKAMVIYYIDANVAGVVYMVAREKVTQILGDKTLDFLADVKIKGKTPAIMDDVKDVKINDVLRVLDKYTGKVDSNGILTVEEFLTTYFEETTIGDAVNVFLPEKLTGKKITEVVTSMKIIDLYKVARGKMGANELFATALDGVKLGDILGYTNESDVWYKDGKAKFEYNPHPTELRMTDSFGYLFKTIVKEVVDTELGKFFAPSNPDIGLTDYISRIKSGDVTFGEMLDHELVDGEWTDGSGDDLAPIWNAMFNLNLKSFEGGAKDVIFDTIGDLRLGEILFDITLNGGVWYYNVNNECVFEDGKLISKIQKNLFKIKINDLLADGEFSADSIMDYLFSDIYIGDAMGYKKVSVDASEFEGVSAFETYENLIMNYGTAGEYKVTDSMYYYSDGTETYFAQTVDGVLYKKAMAVTDQRKLKHGEITDASSVQLGYVWANGEPAVEVGSLYNILANTKLEDIITSGQISLINDLGWLAISDLGLSIGSGTLLDFVKDAPICKIEDEIMAMNLGDVMGYERTTTEEIGVATAVDGIYTYGTDGYYRLVDGVKYVVNDDIADRKVAYGETVAASDYTFVWTEGGVEVSAVNGVLASFSINDVKSGGNALLDQILWLTATDVLGSSVTGNKVFSAIGNEPLCKISVAINGLYVGELMGYSYGTEVTDITGYTTSVGTTVKVNGAGEVIKSVTGANSEIKWYPANGTIAERKGTSATESDYFFKLYDSTSAEVSILNEIIGSMTIEKLTEGGFDTVLDNIQWLTMAEVLGADNSLFNNNIFKNLKNVPITNLGTEINAMYLGEMMGYSMVATAASSSNEVVSGVWEYTDGAVKHYYRVIDGVKYEAKADVATRKATYGETAAASDYTFVWTNSGAEVTDVNEVIASFTIGEITAGGDALLDQILWLTAGEVLGDIAANNAIFNAIGDAPLCKISDAINKLYVGTLMGYEQGALVAANDYNWYELATETIGGNTYYKYNAGGVAVYSTNSNLVGDVDASELVDENGAPVAAGTYHVVIEKVLVTGMKDLMADLTISGIGNTDFNAKVQNLKLKDILNTEGTLLDALVDDDTTIAQAPTAITENIKGLSMYELDTVHGIITIDDEAKDKIDKLFIYGIAMNGYVYPTTRGGAAIPDANEDGDITWVDLTMAEFITEMLKCLPDLTVTP